MSKHAKLVYSLSEGQLDRLIGHGKYPGAQAARDRVDQIKKNGGRPAIYYSEHNGFASFDENDPQDFQRSRSFSRASKPFPI